ncbi:hypothetical protein [Pantanalinema sp. GBBB05]|uniref:hypothetical protein n=1 Tax=Pantanalinema sp. GBBB05 TaxID=2604139 RepID=UPI001DCB4419|nr:hypothetical protein [Pantanalinema sp. GBBB05]
MATDSTSRANFSLTQGGPTDRALERIGFPPHLSRRIVISILVSWLPLLILSTLQGLAIGTTVKIPFLLDIAEQTRLLLVMPLLLVAEPIINSSIKEAVEQFLHEEIVSEVDLPAFKAAIHQGMRWKESAWAEAILVSIIVVFMITYLDVVKSIHLSTWILLPSTSNPGRSLAGWWYTLISMSLYRFLLFRWCWRFIIWSRFLWHVSRLRLQLIPTHPDKAGGIAFLGDTQIRFAILLFSLSAVMAATMANLVVYEQKAPLEFKSTVFSYILLVIILVLLPLFAYTGKLIKVKEQGQLEYSVLGMDYTKSFEQKWIRTDPAIQESLLGNRDVRSLADLARSFAVVRSMNIVPFDFDTVKFLVLATILPFVPLVLTVISLQEVLEKMREFLL